MIVREKKAGDRVKGKIKELQELAKILTLHRTENKKIVHCHGVFDLLHIGHIRHFVEAKRLGDFLVVTLTPDRFVNKGPHRPAFPEQLRAEAVAALDCVDYVAINQWSMAVETVQLLQPDFYVKGPDYKDAEKDRTGGILLEEEAVKGVGGRLVITDGITFSASSLINRHLSILPKKANDYLAGFSGRYSANDIIRYLEGARPLKILVVGETILDEYQYCEAIGKSSKEPMLALKRLSTEIFPGGVLASANHLASFSDNVGLLTFLGEDRPHERFVKENLNSNVKGNFLYRKNSPTIVKRRFVENYFFTKLLEIYEINDSVLDREDDEKLCSILKEEIPRYDVVMVLDYGHSMFTGQAIDILCREARFLGINVQSNAGNLGYNTLSRYGRADYICVAENEIRLEARDRRGDLQQLVLDVSKKVPDSQIVVTRGSKGCLCYSQKEGFFEVPALAGQVVDRMGAGDAFFSLTLLCAAQKAPMEIVGFVGNAAGAQAVATVGHRRFIERTPLFKQIESLLK